MDKQLPGPCDCCIASAVPAALTSSRKVQSRLRARQSQLLLNVNDGREPPEFVLGSFSLGQLPVRVP